MIELEESEIDVVIVNWNSGLFLSNCLNSLHNKSIQKVGKVIVIDNDSSDNSLKILKKYSFELMIVENRHNVGFATACNQGAKLCRSDNILFLNPDTEVFEDTIAQPLKFLKDPDNSSIAVVGVRLEDEKGNFSTSCARFPSLKSYIYRAIGLSFIFPKYFGYTFMSEAECSENIFVDQINGAFFLIRRHVFEKLGGFDERFFMYMDEVDLSFRVKKLGYKSYYMSNVRAFHYGGGCSDQIKDERVFYSLRSRIQFFWKHYSLRYKFLILIEVYILEFISRIIFSLLVMNFKKFLGTFKIYYLLYKWLFSLNKLNKSV